MLPSPKRQTLAARRRELTLAGLGLPDAPNTRIGVLQLADAGLSSLANGRLRVLRHDETIPQIIERDLRNLADVHSVVRVEGFDRSLIEGLERAEQPAPSWARIHARVRGGGDARSVY